VYPHFDLYPTRAAEPASRGEDIANSKFSVSAYPFLVICESYIPFFHSHFLTVRVDHHVYPHFNLYPARAAETVSREEDITNNKLVVSSSTYPFLVICESYIMFFLLLLTAHVDHYVYPHLNLYPARAAEIVSREEDIINNKLVVSSSTYPFLVICESYITFFLLLLTERVDPHVYPHFNLYPSRTAELVTEGKSKNVNVTASSYPHLVICTSFKYATNATRPKSPADPPVYPYFDLYPGIPPRVDAPAASGTSTVIMDHGYPVLNICEYACPLSFRLTLIMIFRPCCLSTL
jgi:hypothetical protein